MMQMTFVDFINQRKVSVATVQEAARLYIGELTEDQSHEELESGVVKAIGNQDFVEGVLTSFEQTHETGDAILLTFLGDKWEEPGEAEKIKRAFDSAGKKLPVIVPAIIAAVTLYAIYAVANWRYVEKTGGVRKTRRIWKRKPDGTVEETEIREYAPPETPDGAVKFIFEAIKKLAADFS